MNGSTGISRKLVIPQPKSYTLGEYLVREERSKEKHEFYNGKIVKMPNAKYNHNLIAMNIACALRIELRKAGKKYIVLGEQKVYIEAENIAVYPDALVIFDKPIFYENRHDLLLNPLLVIEVLSWATSHYDRTAKFDLYQLIPSFQEYVLVNPKKIAIETRHQESANLWRTTYYKEDSQTVTFKYLDITLTMDAIYLIERKTPIPLGSGMKANALRWESPFQKGGAFRFKSIAGSLNSKREKCSPASEVYGMGLARKTRGVRSARVSEGSNQPNFAVR